MSARLLFLALDGGDSQLFRELEQAGRLPVLAELRRRGAAVELETMAALLPDSAVWPPLLTGGAAARSAVLHFEDFEPATMGTSFKHEATDNTEPFWLHLPDRGARTLVLDVPDVHFHPETRADEACCWHMFAPTHAPAFSSRGLARRLRRLGRPAPLPYPFAESTLAEQRAFSRRLVESVRLRFRTALELESEYETVCVGAHELHAALHWLGQHWVPGHWYRPVEPEPELVTAVYEAVDEELAPLLDRFADDNVVLAIARGMRAANGAEHLLEELLARGGLLQRRAGGLGPGGPGGQRAWATQTLRNLIPARTRERVAMRLLPQEVQYRLAARRFRDGYVWHGTQAFPVPSWTTGGIRVNLHGREAAGIVARDALDEVLSTVEGLIAETVDAATGLPLARAVIRTSVDFPEWQQLPDLLVDWAGDRPAAAAHHPRLGTWSAAPRIEHLWTVHDSAGLVLLAGPGVLRLDDPVRADLAGAAATMLALKGIRAPASVPAPAWDVVLAHAPANVRGAA